MIGPATGLLALSPPAAPASEPRVCPLPEKPMLDFAGAFAASAAADKTAVRRAVAFAPRTVSFTEEPLRIRKVGILRTTVSTRPLRVVSTNFGSTHAEMPYVPATSLWLSTLTLQKVIRPGFDSAAASCSNMGEMTLQGPHQSA